MKRSGTLKLEIIKPTNDTWARVGQRMRAVRATLPVALNLAMRDVFTGVLNYIESALEKEKSDRKWEGDVPKRLAFHWSRQLERRRDYQAGKGRKGKPHDDSAFAPIGEVWCAETSDHILSRFKGEHFRDLLAGRAGVPTFEGGGKAFMVRSRACSVKGKPEEARLSLPLWGTGAKATEFAVAPCGGSARALWGRLVRGAEARDKIVKLEAAAKPGATKRAKDRAAHELVDMRAIKMGRVGVKYDERRQKWYALISWSEYGEEGYREGQAAAANFGCHVLIQAMAEDGTTWDRAGGDVIATRERFAARRRSIARSMRAFGRGGRGHGVKRHQLPITRLSDSEARWVQNWIRAMAADLLSWCKEHAVSDLYLEDLTGIRETFERETGGEAHEKVKRLIHQWPFYQAQQAIERQAQEFGVRCHYKAAHNDSRRCPSCKHTDAENVKTVESRGNAPVVVNGVPYYRFEKKSWFECVACSLRAQGDVITCANHLIDVGKTHALEKMQEKSRQRSKGGAAKTASGVLRKESAVAAAE